MYKLIPAEHEDVEKFCDRKNYLKKLGNMNEWPEPYEEISGKEALSFMTGVLPEMAEVRYIPGLKRALYVFWFEDRGIGIGHDITSNYENHVKRFDRPPTYYRFGCRHDFAVEVGRVKTWKEATCKKCGLKQTWDSSD